MWVARTDEVFVNRQVVHSAAARPNGSGVGPKGGKGRKGRG